MWYPLHGSSSSWKLSSAVLLRQHKQKWLNQHRAGQERQQSEQGTCQPGTSQPLHAHVARVCSRAAPLPSHLLHEMLSRSCQPGAGLSLHALRNRLMAAWAAAGQSPSASSTAGPGSGDGPEAAGPPAAVRVHEHLPAETQPLVTPAAGAGGKYVCKQEVKLLCSAALLIIFAVAEPAVEGGF